MTLASAASAGQAQDRADRRLQAELAAAVKQNLPDSWSITRTRAGVNPPDWHTMAPTAGFLVEGGSRKDSLHIWFLPLDWIGIHTLPGQSQRILIRRRT
jgi:hypothetical protein